MENRTEYIDDYFNGNLNPEERKRFEKQMETDRNFAEEVAFYLAAKHALKEELASDKKEWFRQLASQNLTLSEQAEEKRSARVTRMWVYRIAAAAVLVGVIFFSWNLFFQPSTSPYRLADKYIAGNLESLSITMGLKDSMQEGLRLFNEKQYAASAQQFEQVIQRDTSNYRAKTYAGVAYLRLGNYDKALEYFQQLEKYSLYSNPSLFYQALTLMKRNQPGDKEKARQLLQNVVDSDLEGKEAAQRWLDKKW